MATQADATDRAAELLGHLVVSDLAMAAHVEWASVPDSAGVSPGGAGWVPTFDPYMAAAHAAYEMAVTTMGAASITQWSSEGTTLHSTPADLFGMAERLYQLSPWHVRSTGSLRVLSLPRSGLPFRPRSEYLMRTPVGVPITTLHAQQVANAPEPG